ncbi:uncharacterized protein LOC129595287 isoform X2 [Paramacrobiotus metropolitanus]|uniref:uncharacterized protein LOC129595287 isoform X2 n=1 Tax=Paramacrobiotus metropolitanus TaxID=2943436 RepID=UPI00244653C9|nr:uncharacterized protein LOC129595287 isoform X2 [Paramacrobiotus metropolitanus]
MLEYGSFYVNPVWHYGAVDAQDKDGSFRHGFIVDMDPAEGFIIDFGYPGHHAELIPFSRCFGKIPQYLFASGDAVQVLWRSSDNEALCWYPAKVIAGSYYTFAFVETERHGKSVREVVRKHCIMPLGERPALTRKNYKRHRLPLNWIILILAKARSQQDFQWWNRQHGHRSDTILVKVERGKLIFIAHSSSAVTSSEFVTYTTKDSRWPRSWSLTEVFRIMANRVTFCELSIWRRAGSKRRGRRLSSKSGVASKFRPRYRYRPCPNNYLPVEIFRRIFSFLEFREQVKCCSVCKFWHTILTTCSRLEFDLQTYGHDDLALAFDKNISEFTRKIILSGNIFIVNCKPNAWYYSRLFNPVAILTGLLKAKSIKLQTITISDWHVWAPDVLSWSRSLTLQFRSDWKDLCDKLVLDNVYMNGLVYVDAESCGCNGKAFVGPYNNRFRYMDFDTMVYSRSVRVMGSSPIERMGKYIINTNQNEQMQSARTILEDNCLPMRDEVLRMLESRLDKQSVPKKVLLQHFPHAKQMLPIRPVRICNWRVEERRITALPIIPVSRRCKPGLD